MPAHIVAIVNQKGGVGKTTFTVNAAAAAGQQGARVAVIDLDPQANATAAMLPDLDIESAITSNDVLDSGISGAAGPALRPSPWSDRLMVLPSELSLARREHDTSLALEFRLRTALEGVCDDYDLILVDCPPNIGRLTTNALVAADYALIVSEPARASVQGLVGVTETIDLVQKSYNAKLQLAGIVINRLENTREAIGRVRELEEAFGDQVWQPPVPKRAAVAEAYGAAVPVNRMPSSGAVEAWDAISRLATRLLALAPVPVEV